MMTGRDIVAFVIALLVVMWLIIIMFSGCAAPDIYQTPIYQTPIYQRSICTVNDKLQGKC